MIIIGELINSTRPKVKKAIKEKDEAYIRNLVKIQVEAGAAYLDLNAAMSMKNELSDLKWLIDIIQDETDVPLAIDTPDLLVMKKGVEYCKKPPLINSITNEDKREELIKIAKEYNTEIILLPLGMKKGIPKTKEERIEEAKILMKEIDNAGIDRKRIYIDCIVMSVGSDQFAGKAALETVRAYKEEFPGVKTVGGLSNVSFGLPDRKLLNRAFIAMMINEGLDAAIIDPCDEKLVDIINAAEALAGKDKYCLNYMNYVKGRQ